MKRASNDELLFVEQLNASVRKIFVGKLREVTGNSVRALMEDPFATNSLVSLRGVIANEWSTLCCEVAGCEKQGEGWLTIFLSEAMVRDSTGEALERKMTTV